MLDLKPVTREATAICKGMEMTHGNSLHYLTFELDSGERVYFQVSMKCYMMIIEGDRCLITYKDSRNSSKKKLKSFEIIGKTVPASTQTRMTEPILASTQIQMEEPMLVSTQTQMIEPILTSPQMQEVETVFENEIEPKEVPHQKRYNQGNQNRGNQNRGNQNRGKSNQKKRKG